eukprot:TRINITY_DN650_c2_g2_i1.p1 TRINITY_DN650_c2_g2~~TRINITY_DN650_c2_g2_i1.p1  ORF type:complete len:917 (-),score=509.21 TRINITY_DN650_c2_g2_i1:60-2810(-)
MASRWQQGSKYRWLQATPFKREQWYTDLNISTATENTLIAVSSEQIAAVWNSTGGGSVALLPVNQPGKRFQPTPPLIHAHSAAITDLVFSPFNNQLLATAGEDAALKLWQIPNVVDSNITTPLTVLTGHERKTEAIRFNPTASNVLASGSDDKSIKIWDIETSTARFTLQLGNSASSLSWSYDGSQLAITTKEKKLTIIEPRTNAIVQSVEAHVGSKPARVLWLGDLQRILTTGFSKNRDRQYAVWDPRNLTNALQTTNIDQSTGTLIPLFDNDAKLLYLGGKGDNTIRFFEVVADKPYLKELNNSISEQQRDIALLPKLSVDIGEVEIDRIYKINATSIIPIRFTVPRKTKIVFPCDLYPDTASSDAALSANEWFNGQTSNPRLCAFNSRANITNSGSNAASSTSTSTTSTSSTTSTTSTTSTISSPAISSYSSSTTEPENEYIPKEISLQRGSRLKHIVGKGTKKEACFDNIKLFSASADMPSIKTNGKSFAVPWQGAGGRVAVVSLDRPFRLPDTPGLVECGSNVFDFDLSPFNINDNIQTLVTGCEDGHIKVWRVPLDLITQKKNQREFAIDLIGHSRKVTSVNFHPIAENLLFSTAFDGSLRIWDITRGSEGLVVRDAFQDLVQSITFEGQGSLVAIATKDRLTKIIDPRAGSIIHSFESHQGAKGIRLSWLENRQKLISVGFSKTSDRELKVWDLRQMDGSLSSPIITRSIDVASGVLTPLFDAGIGVMFLAGRGDANISYYEILDSEPWVHSLSAYTSTAPQVDVAMIPYKTNFDVRNVEITRLLKLTTSTVEPISFTVPRTRLEFFQDDIYPPTPSGQPALNAPEWISGVTKAPILTSLQPSGMQALSQAPKIVREKKYKFDPNKKDDNDNLEEKVLDSFYKQMQAQKEQFNNFKTDTNNAVDDSEWD